MIVEAKASFTPAGIVSMTPASPAQEGVSSLCFDCDSGGDDPGCDSGCVCDTGGDSGDCYGGSSERTSTP